MKIPAFLDKLLSDGDEATVGKNDPVRDPNQIPGMEGQKKKGKGKGILGISNGRLLILGVVLLVVIISILTLPDTEQKTNTVQYKYVDLTDAVDFGGLRFSITDTAASTRLVGDTKSKYSPASGNTIYAITFSLKNVASSTQSMVASSGTFGKTSSRYGYALRYETSDGQIVTYLPIQQSGNSMLLNGYDDDIIPLQSITGVICFEVPLEVTTSETPLYVDVYTSSYVCRWIIRDRPVPETTDQPSE